MQFLVLGYVGCVSLVYCKKWFNVIGVDINKTKINKVNNNNATIYEKGLDKLIKDNSEGFMQLKIQVKLF